MLKTFGVTRIIDDFIDIYLCMYLQNVRIERSQECTTTTKPYQNSTVIKIVPFIFSLYKGPCIYCDLW